MLYRLNPEDRKRRERERYAAAVQARADARRRRKYGMEPDEWYRRQVEQDNRCAICRRRFGTERYQDTPRVDHDHATGAVRGLLCHPCNRALGLLHDDPDVFRRAADYLSGALV
jgi:hypothetical protein